MTDHEQAAFGGAGSIRRRTGDELVAAWKAGRPPASASWPAPEEQELPRRPPTVLDSVLVVAIWVASASIVAAVVATLWILGRAM